MTTILLSIFAFMLVLGILFAIFQTIKIRNEIKGYSFNGHNNVQISTKDDCMPMLNGTKCDSVFTDTVNESHKEVVVGIGPFHDAMIMYVGIEAGFFNKVGLSVKPITLEWQNVFSDLLAHRADIVIGNKEMCEMKNKMQGGPYFQYHQDIHFYDGFAIMIRPKPGLKTFLELRNKNRESDEKKLQIRTLQQLKGLKIIASKETDHSENLIDCARLAGLIVNKDFNLIGNYTEYEGLEKFLNGEADAYVGGISQRLIARRHGMKELIAQDETNLNLTQQNGFITAIASSFPKEVMDRLVFAWFETIQEIGKDPKKYSARITHFLKTSITIPSSKLDFIDDDFTLIWDNWEKFPENVKEARKESDNLIKMNEYPKTQRA